MSSKAEPQESGQVYQEITRILRAAQTGEGNSTEDLIPPIYDELRRLAAYRMSIMQAGQTLQPTALVHEVYLKLLRPDGENWVNRRHFFTAAAEAMRRILIDHDRRRRSLKRGGDLKRTEIDVEALPCTPPGVDFLDLNLALDELAREDPESAELVKMRYFTELTLEEVASVLGVSKRTVSNRWAYAKAWLHCRLFDAE
jgi:RNA polymerase sigma factor (TIGR02999 family)